MKIDDLRALIADLPGDMPVLIPFGDHAYSTADAGIADVWRSKPLSRPVEYSESDVEGNTNAQAFVVSTG